MPYYTSTAPIAADALNILGNPARQATMRSDLKSVIASLGTTNAAARAADIAINMIRSRQTSASPV
jgi:hypothetical protein